MANDPNDLTYDLDETRSHLVDLSSRARVAVGEKVDQLKTVVSDTAARLADAVPTRGDLKAGSDKIAAIIKDNPIGFAAGSVAIGFLMGLVLPKTSIEADRVEDMKRMAIDSGSQAVEAGKRMVLDSVTATLRGRRTTDGGGL